MAVNLDNYQNRNHCLITTLQAIKAKGTQNNYMQASFISQLLQRLGSKSPAFFRKLQWSAGIIAVIFWLFNSALTAGVLTIPNQDRVVDWLNGIAGTFTGIVIGALTSTTNPALVDTEVKEKVIDEAQNQ